MRFKFELRVVDDERIALAMVGVDDLEDNEDDGGGCVNSRGDTISPPPASVLCILVVDNDDEVAMDDANLAWILSLCCCCGLSEVRWWWWYRFVNPENGNRRLLPPLLVALPRALLPFFPKGLFRTDSRNDWIAEDGIFSTPLSWACCRPRIPMVINHTIVPPMASNNAIQV